MKWEYDEKDRISYPVLTKGWRIRWFVAGVVLGFITPILAFFFYRWRLPNIPTVAKIAVKFSLLGAVFILIVRFVLAYLLV